MLTVARKDAVAICKALGYHMADSWKPAKLDKIFAELVELADMDDFRIPADAPEAERLQALFDDVVASRGDFRLDDVERTARAAAPEATAPEATAPEATVPEATAPEAASEATAPEAALEATVPEATVPNKTAKRAKKIGLQQLGMDIVCENPDMSFDELVREAKRRLGGEVASVVPLRTAYGVVRAVVSRLRAAGLMA